MGIQTAAELSTGMGSHAGETVKVFKIQADFKPPAVIFFKKSEFGFIWQPIFIQIKPKSVIFYTYPSFLNLFSGLRAQ
jgi:hypothetical protein